MLSKNKVSEIVSLHQKKYRQISGLFIVEGEKIVNEVLASTWQIKELFATSELYDKYVIKYPNLVLSESHLFSKISSLKTPSGILAVVEQDKCYIESVNALNRFTLCLDGVRDPGNLGTIIRIADWFGIQNIICSNDTVDLYNAKTIQSTMGSFLRVNVVYTDLSVFLAQIKVLQIPILGAVLNGENVYKKQALNQGLIVMGSESHGISKEVLHFIEPITIPSKLLANVNDVNSTSIDSLNVATATSILCAVLAGKFNS